jgi:hypothetical protein
MKHAEIRSLQCKIEADMAKTPVPGRESTG